mgnify:CR=1 FL=1
MIRLKAENLAKSKDIWELHDFMTKEINNIEKSYDYRYSVLLLVFSRLKKDSWLRLDEVKYLSEDKLERLNEILKL